jgi:hypothetical protein
MTRKHRSIGIAESELSIALPHDMAQGGSFERVIRPVSSCNRLRGWRSYGDMNLLLLISPKMRYYQPTFQIATSPCSGVLNSQVDNPRSASKTTKRRSPIEADLWALLFRRVTA